MSWGRLSDMIETADSLNMFEGFVFVFGFIENRTFVVDLIAGEGTKFGQLWNGIDGKGRMLSDLGGAYSRATIEIKRNKGLPIDRVTLYDTGEFYESFRVQVKNDGLQVIADTVKEGEDLRDRWGDAILTMTSDNKIRLVREIIPFYRNWLKQKLLA